ncbi:MAG: hypothetical protein R3D62_04555 [Xanthobacteraceae bacterium]
MKFVLDLTKQGQTLGRHICDVNDAESFAAACGELWSDLERRSLEQATSIGDLMENVNEGVFLQLDGAVLSFSKA